LVFFLFFVWRGVPILVFQSREVPRGTTGAKYFDLCVHAVDAPSPPLVFEVWLPAACHGRLFCLPLIPESPLIRWVFGFVPKSPTFTFPQLLSGLDFVLVFSGLWVGAFKGVRAVEGRGGTREWRTLPERGVEIFDTLGGVRGGDRSF